MAAAAAAVTAGLVSGEEREITGLFRESYSVRLVFLCFVLPYFNFYFGLGLVSILKSVTEPVSTIYGTQFL